MRVLGQKKLVVIGIVTVTISPPISISCLISISGEFFFICSRKYIESLANMFCAKLFIVDCSLSPFTEVITCLNLVVISGETVESFLNFLSSSSMSLSSLPVSILYVIFVLDIGNSNSN